MGTRALIAVQLDGQYRIAQYGQWDGYPSGVGLEVLQFARDHMVRAQFEEQLRKCVFAEDAEFSRDTSGEILKQVQGGTVRFLRDSIVFAGDSLFCEWAYVIDLDRNHLEVYSGFQKEGHTGQRFSLDQTEYPKIELESTEGYAPVEHVQSFDMRNLPTDAEFLAILEPAEAEGS